MGGGGEQTQEVKNEPWSGQVPYLTGSQIAPVITNPVPINSDWLAWSNQVAQTGMPSAPPPMNMNNPMLSGNNVYAGQPNIFGQGYPSPVQQPMAAGQSNPAQVPTPGGNVGFGPGGGTGQPSQLPVYQGPQSQTPAPVPNGSAPYSNEYLAGLFSSLENPSQVSSWIADLLSKR